MSFPGKVLAKAQAKVRVQAKAQVQVQEASPPSQPS